MCEGSLSKGQICPWYGLVESAPPPPPLTPPFPAKWLRHPQTPCHCLKIHLHSSANTKGQNWKGEKTDILQSVFSYLYTRKLSLFLVYSVVCFWIAYASADSRKVWLQTAGNKALEMFETEFRKEGNLILNAQSIMTVITGRHLWSTISTY